MPRSPNHSRNPLTSPHDEFTTDRIFRPGSGGWRLVTELNFRSIADFNWALPSRFGLLQNYRFASTIQLINAPTAIA